MDKGIDVYNAARTLRPQVKAKHLRQFDREFLRPAAADPSMSVLEIGCGTGIFLRYLKARGFTDVTGLDSDAGLAPVLDDLAGFHIQLTDGASFLAGCPDGHFDRVALFDVAEHLTPTQLKDLMLSVRRVLKPGGRVVLRSPNCASPWGLKMQFDTFDHITPITANRLRELAAATGFTFVAALGGQTHGGAVRRWAERVVHRLLSACLTYHPDFWEATIVGVMEKAP
ncbi:MAG TPA: class I SAM-dependent methyltransferase [Magnetospirillum sp.]|nr:class I SAM-dependent methyltransferase [Magnetospirillum sp.]